MIVQQMYVFPVWVHLVHCHTVPLNSMCIGMKIVYEDVLLCGLSRVINVGIKSAGHCSVCYFVTPAFCVVNINKVFVTVICAIFIVSDSASLQS